MPSECKICNKTYKSPQSLWNHKNRCHQIKEQVDKNMPAQNVENVFPMLKVNGDMKQKNVILKLINWRMK